MEKNEIVQHDNTLSMEISLQESKNRFADLQKFVAEQMKEKEDYGTIPGCGPKPVLFKPGAEKLEFIYGLSHEYELLSKTEDWEKGFFFYQYRCKVTHRKTGKLMGEAIGSCNSKERGRGGQDPYSVVNTIDKMAQKRAFVGAILAVTRLSNQFTQDLEDVPEAVNGRKNVTPQCSACKASISDKVSKFSAEKYGKALCMDCQQKVKS